MNMIPYSAKKARKVALKNLSDSEKSELLFLKKYFLEEIKEQAEKGKNFACMFCVESVERRTFDSAKKLKNEVSRYLKKLDYNVIISNITITDGPFLAIPYYKYSFKVSW